MNELINEYKILNKKGLLVNELVHVYAILSVL